MPADLVVMIRKGETRPVYGQVLAPSGGTATIASGGKYTLYDGSGAVVTGHDNADVTGYDNTAGAAPRAWKLLSTGALTEGAYRMVFTLSVTNSVDGMTRVLKPSVAVRVEPVV